MPEQLPSSPGSYHPGAPLSLLTTGDVAHILKKTKWAVRSYVRSGKLHAYRIGHGFRFTPQMLENYLQTQRVG